MNTEEKENRQRAEGKYIFILPVKVFTFFLNALLDIPVALPQIQFSFSSLTLWALLCSSCKSVRVAVSLDNKLCCNKLSGMSPQEKEEEEKKGLLCSKWASRLLVGWLEERGPFF